MQNDCSFGVKGAVVFESRLEQLFNKGRSPTLIPNRRWSGGWDIMTKQ